jgi:hypothetical protein
MAYTAVLGAVEHFAPALWRVAVAHHVPMAADSSVSADGAEWIWNVVADYFPDSVQIIDWYHATQHLASAAQALFPQDAKQAQTWFIDRCEDLFQGHIARIITPLEQQGLSDTAHYFRVHQRPYGSKINLRVKQALGGLPIIVADDPPEHVSIANRAVGCHSFQSK